MSQGSGAVVLNAARQKLYHLKPLKCQNGYALTLQYGLLCLLFIYGSGVLGIVRTAPSLLLEPTKSLLPIAKRFRKSAATNKPTEGSIRSLCFPAVYAPQQYASTQSTLFLVGSQPYVLPSSVCMYPHSKSDNS